MAACVASAISSDSVDLLDSFQVSDGAKFVDGQLLQACIKAAVEIAAAARDDCAHPAPGIAASGATAELPAAESQADHATGVVLAGSIDGTDVAEDSHEIGSVVANELASEIAKDSEMVSAITGAVSNFLPTEDAALDSEVTVSAEDSQCDSAIEQESEVVIVNGDDATVAVPAAAGNFEAAGQVEESDVVILANLLTTNDAVIVDKDLEASTVVESESTDEVIIKEIEQISVMATNDSEAVIFEHPNGIQVKEAESEKSVAVEQVIPAKSGDSNAPVEAESEATKVEDLPLPTAKSVDECEVKPPESYSFSFTGLNHVAFCVESLERSLEFYCGLLGLKTNMDRPELPYRGAWLYLGAEGIHIMEVPNPDPMKGRPSHGGYDRHACINVKNVEGVRLTLEKAGIPYQPSIVPSLFARDPDGNGLEFIEVA